MVTTTPYRSTRATLFSRPGGSGSVRSWLMPLGLIATLGLARPASGFDGIATNVPLSALSGWSQCFRSGYADKTFLPVVLDQCKKANLMLACRPTGASTLTVAAHAPREDVLFPVTRRQVPHEANGALWYFDEQWSWGFGPVGEPILRSSCDTVGSTIDGFTGPDPEKRLCWHTEASFINPGWRCGRADFLSQSSTFERVILEADVVPPSTAQCGNGIVDGDEECDDGGVCIGGMTAGQACTADGDCAGNGVCDAGPKLGHACSADTDCPSSRCVRCRTFGGDGCAANCTMESDVPFNLIPGSATDGDLVAGTSGTTLVSQALGHLPLPFSGALVLTVGKERHGAVPLVAKAAGMERQHIEAGDFGCVCVRGVEARTCGGTLYDLDGTLSKDCSAGFTAGAAVCPADRPCAPLHGAGNIAAGTIGCGGFSPVNANVTQDCNGVPGAPAGNRSLVLSGLGATGSGLLFGTFAIGNNGVCLPDFCSDSDPPGTRGTPVTVPLTTGSVAANVTNAADTPGLSIATMPLSGAAFSCTALAKGDAGGAALVSAMASCNEPAGQDSVRTTRLAAAPSTSPQCGNAHVDSGEECDDGGLCAGGAAAGTACTKDSDCGGDAQPGVCSGGARIGATCATSSECPGAVCVRCRPVGGDGCAANCTFETDVAYDLVTGVATGSGLAPGTSGATLLTEVVPQLPLPLSGTQTLTLGKERDGQIPMVVRTASVAFAPMLIGGSACGCLRPVEVKTCGGALYESDGVTPSLDCTDNYTPGATVCPANRACAPVHGPGNSASGVIGCAGLANTTVTTQRNCNPEPGGTPSTPLVQLSGGGPAGSALLLNSLALGIQLGDCTADFCSEITPLELHGTPLTVPFTTGTATARIDDANDIADFSLGPRTITGAPFSCAALEATLPSVEGALLVGAFATCDETAFGDAVVTTQLAGAAPLAPLPTNTPTPSRTPTATPTTTPTPEMELQVGQAILTTAQRNASIPVSLTNSLPVRAVQLTLTDIPHEITLRSTAPCVVSPRASALTCSATQVGNEIRVVMLPIGNADIAPGSGTLLTLLVDDTPPFCPAGSAIDLTLGNTLLGGSDGMPLAHTLANGSLLCDCKGDIDASVETNVIDALACVDFILERRRPTSAEHERADLTCDGVIDIFDCIGIVDIILGQRTACPLCR
jgi:hypothetical protein